MKKAILKRSLTAAFLTLSILISGMCSFAAPGGRHNDPVTGNVSPVSLTAFNVKQSKKTVSLEWATSREMNTNLFIVQRSLDGKTYVEISRIVSGDDSYVHKAYSFDDDRAIRNNTMVFYRLKIVDRDGQFVYSDVKMVTKERMAEIHY